MFQRSVEPLSGSRVLHSWAHLVICLPPPIRHLSHQAPHIAVSSMNRDGPLYMLQQGPRLGRGPTPVGSTQTFQKSPITGS